MAFIRAAGGVGEEGQVGEDEGGGRWLGDYDPKDHKGSKECHACCESAKKCAACCHDKGKGEECKACCFDEKKKK